MHKPKFLFLSLATVAGVALLVGLGVWQLQRREWKHALIMRIEARASAAPVALAQVLAAWRETGDVEYMRLKLRGNFLPGKEFHLYAIVEGTPGWRIVTPFKTDSGNVVLVDRGFVPDRLMGLQAPFGRAPPGEIELIGLARAPANRGWFEPLNEPERNRWYWRDLGGMAAQLPPEQRARTVPFFVEAEAGAWNGKGEWPRAGVTRLRLRDPHLEYALTWFGLALVLIVVSGFFMRSQLQRNGGNP